MNLALLTPFTNRWLIATTAGLVVLVSACSGGTTSVPDGAVIADGSPSAGAAVYASKCASCHGGDLGGTSQGPSHLSIVYEPSHHPDGAFATAVRNGAQQHHWEFGPMPPVGGMSDEDIADVIAFVRSEQERQGFIGG